MYTFDELSRPERNRTTMAASEPLLCVRDLVASVHTDRGRVRVVDGVSFDVPAGARVSVVGESGCGKTVTCLALLRLLPQPDGLIESGEVRFGGTDLLPLSERAMRAYRGRKLSMVFQEPATALNPVYRVGSQIGEVVRVRHGGSRAQIRARTLELLALVGIAAPEVRIDAYPHQLSGGMRQRVMVAMALACEPELLIADEPTAALDVTTQAQILDLLRKLSDARGMSTVLVTRDLGVVAEFSEQVVVMYAGQVVESGPVHLVFRQPMHPYTNGLLSCIPPFVGGAPSPQPRAGRLQAMPGTAPHSGQWGTGCRFADRCPHRAAACERSLPPLVEMSEGRRARCFFAGEWPALTKGPSERV